MFTATVRITYPTREDLESAIKDYVAELNASELRQRIGYPLEISEADLNRAVQECMERIWFAAGSTTTLKELVPPPPEEGEEEDLLEIDIRFELTPFDWTEMGAGVPITPNSVSTGYGFTSETFGIEIYCYTSDGGDVGSKIVRDAFGKFEHYM